MSRACSTPEIRNVKKILPKSQKGRKISETQLNDGKKI